MYENMTKRELFVEYSHLLNEYESASMQKRARIETRMMEMLGKLKEIAAIEIVSELTKYLQENK